MVQRRLKNEYLRPAVASGKNEDIPRLSARYRAFVMKRHTRIYLPACRTTRSRSRIIPLGLRRAPVPRVSHGGHGVSATRAGREWMHAIYLLACDGLVSWIEISRLL